VKRRELSTAFALIGSKTYSGPLAYALGRMRLRLGKERDEVEHRRKEENAFGEAAQAYLKGRREIVTANASRDEHGQLVPDRMGNIQIADAKKFDAEIKAFDEANLDAKAALNTEEKALADWLAEDIAIEQWKGQASWLPETGTPEEMAVICELVDIPENDQAASD
jgi:hypothetical protein